MIQCLEPGTLEPSGYRTIYAAVDADPFDPLPMHASLAHPAVALEEENERVLLDGSIDANLTLVSGHSDGFPPLYLRFNDIFVYFDHEDFTDADIHNGDTHMRPVRYDGELVDLHGCGRHPRMPPAPPQSPPSPVSPDAPSRPPPASAAARGCRPSSRR